ncbi:P-loop containing nucleoside triphosphate hydrolase protein [Lipomyces tetrasporus]|uniref:RNA helicase n=1 Tax=Lipomyces tetrasporus TaxID=54092 RepID=A0AAD7QRH1_9ASCO|nr:P-loop containing nucleoside triphosphate hydrolase protein [Lipomyces tetrasporus]KAJ8099621.1 P-loop containing nucleoside triphosphate hydrolase protein [Lipomyces tetrasporus]
MDFFRLLARGTKLDDTAAFTEKEKVVEDEDKLAKSLDFFHTHTISAPEARQIAPKHEGEPESHEPVIPYGKSKVTGPDVPHPLTEFKDLASRFQVSESLISRVKFPAPTQIQSEAIPGMLHDRDILACAPTGSGKTLAYVLPIAHILLKQQQNSTGGIRALILVPTKELALQVSEAFTILTRGTTSFKVNVLTKSLLARLTSETGAKAGDVLISTPLRLVRALAVLDFDSLRHLVLDEADKLFDPAFAPQTDDILAHLRGKTLQKTFLSATVPSSVETLALSLMTTPLRILISPGRAAATVAQKLIYAGSEAGKLLAIRQMLKTGELTPPVLIFVQSIERANALFHELVYDGVNVDVLHGERTETQRRAVVERFKKAEVWVLICTDVLARGVDVHGVNLVINYDVPQSAQAYIHRIGRTGRAGKEGKAVTFFTKDDVESVKIVINVMKESGCAVDEWMTRLGKVDKKTKKQLKRKPVERDDISTQPKRRKRKNHSKEKIDGAEKSTKKN